MLLETLPIYQSWDLTTFPLPPRSYLYSLQPCGTGSAHVESFTSYLARLAQAHGISISALIRYQLTPRFILHQSCSKTPKLDSSRARFEEWFSQPQLLQETVAGAWMDGTKQVEQVVTALEELTLRQDLRYLTLLPLQSLLSLRHVFHTEQLWCPGCYQESRDLKAFFYEPLLWALDIVNVCPRHQCYLQLWCSNCRSLQPFLNLQGQRGYCCVCRNWLGRFLEPQVCHYSKTKQTAWDFWAAEAVGQILAAMPLLSGMNRKPLKGQGRKPGLRAFLKRCYKLGLLPVNELVQLCEPIL